MSEDKSLPVVEIDADTMDQLQAATAKFYKLLKEGKEPGSSADAAQALKELTDVTETKLQYDEDSETWKDK